MADSIVSEKAERIRDVIRYIERFKDALVVIYIDEELLDSNIFLNHIKDICLIHEVGLKVIVVPGASKRIDQVLTDANLKWTIHNNSRITSPEAMPLIKMAAFDVSNQIMTALAGEKKTAVIGNWVRARSKGIIDGFDYGTSGEIDKLQTDSIKTVLDNGFIPIFPCIGWSLTGKPYNISSIELSKQIAVHLKADKLFFLVPNAKITTDSFIIPETIGRSLENTIPAMNLEEVDDFLNENKSIIENVNYRSLVYKIISLLNLAKDACKEGVTRVHILNGSVNGSVPCEIFSDFGSGTMIYSNNYGKIRPMTYDDIGTVISLMQPFVDKGILLPRTKESFSSQYQHYIVYELDGAIRACASLIPYEDNQMEIAGVTVDKNYSHIGIGPKLIQCLIDKAVSREAKSVFLLTTQTSDWFEKFGFTEDDISTIPAKRRELWTSQRGSKVMRKYL